MATYIISTIQSSRSEIRRRPRRARSPISGQGGREREQREGRRERVKSTNLIAKMGDGDSEGSHMHLWFYIFARDLEAGANHRPMRASYLCCHKKTEHKLRNHRRHRRTLTASMDVKFLCLFSVFRSRAVAAAVDEQGGRDVRHEGEACRPSPRGRRPSRSRAARRSALARARRTRSRWWTGDDVRHARTSTRCLIKQIKKGIKDKAKPKVRSRTSFARLM